MGHDVPDFIVAALGLGLILFFFWARRSRRRIESWPRIEAEVLSSEPRRTISAFGSAARPDTSWNVKLRFSLNGVVRTASVNLESPPDDTVSVFVNPEPPHTAHGPVHSGMHHAWSAVLGVLLIMFAALRAA
jgi:hypothetical protein